jgi:glycogen phosphorylase
MPGREFTLEVVPNLPEEVGRLAELADNLWYSWHRPARSLFGLLDPALWRRVGHNPKLFLRRVDEALLRQAARDEVYLASYRAVLSTYDTYHGAASSPRPNLGLGSDDLVAYLCAEYGLHESLPIYSGGLGILAGHHCKTASDLRLPFVAVGLLYRVGYFSQHIDGEGRQLARYLAADSADLPVRPVLDDGGRELRIRVDFPGRALALRVWQVEVGHVRVVLLDTNVEENAESDRGITNQLYPGDGDRRLQQELILGIGGVRVLRRLGHQPTVWHLNEGHPAFSILERVREQVTEGLSFEAALEAVAAATVFTTHTPVPAGHDRFDPGAVLAHLVAAFNGKEIPGEWLQALGRTPSEPHVFNMTTLAVRGSRHVNGVSRLHGEVSSTIVAECWPEVPPEENPVDHVTNGVHIPTVLAQEWIDFFDRHYGAEWRNRLCDPDYWRRIHEIPDHIYWSIRQTLKARMLTTVREALVHQHLRNRVSAPHIERILGEIHPNNPNVLTIGFARRFATYKRAGLLFNDLDWLRQLVGDPARPVIFVFAGKAHPADEPGQRLLRQVHEIAQRTEFLGRILLLEGYDLWLARRLFSGVDVWLNTPIHTHEASGTSGMKAAVNGTLNLSIADGWWAEGFHGDNGWSISPSAQEHDDIRRDAEDARTLYEILQDQVLPLYYGRNGQGYSPGWVLMAKQSMVSVLPRFNMERVLTEYATRLYAPAAREAERLSSDGFRGALELAAWKQRVAAAWPRVGLRRLDEPVGRIRQGQALRIEVAVQLDALSPDDVVVELLFGRPRPGELPASAAHLMTEVGNLANRPKSQSFRRTLRLEAVGRTQEGGEHRYRLEANPGLSGRLVYRLRIYPTHELLSHPFETGLMRWLQ